MDFCFLVSVFCLIAMIFFFGFVVGLCVGLSDNQNTTSKNA
jgi:hypothetical protein